MKWIFTLAVLFIVHFGNAQICTSPNTTIYGLSNAGFIYSINVSNAVTSAALNPAYSGNSPSNANGLGYNNVNGKFYYFKRSPNASPQEFISFDPGTNTYVTLASSPGTGSVNTGCVNAAGTGYYCLDNTPSLYYYNISANTWTLITSSFFVGGGGNITSTLGARTSGDMAFDGNGKLWILASNSSQFGLYYTSGAPPVSNVSNITLQQHIAPTTATPNSTSIAGIAFNPSGQIYLSTTGSDNKLYRLENNLSLTTIAAFSTSAVGGDLASCSYPSGVLPLFWSNVSVKEKNGFVQLNWDMSLDFQPLQISIERSANSGQWSTLGSVVFQSNGMYNFSDEKPLPGNNIYRVVIEKSDGSFIYSPFKTINFQQSRKISLGPNPAVNEINIYNSSSQYVGSINDLRGKQVQIIQSSSTNKIDVRQLNAGIYVIKLIFADGVVLNEKIQIKN